MKQKILMIVLGLFICLTGLTGCSAAKAFEKDLQVIMEVNGEYYGCETVNIFNNAILTEPKAPESKVFKGWTTQETWDEADADNVPVLANRGLVRYEEVESAVKGKEQSVVIRAVFIPAPKRDLVIAWYAKEGTSGLNQTHIDTFTKKLYDYLKSDGYDPDKMDIVIRGYEGGVADTCAAIKADADVDFMLGWSTTSNITGTGGWTEGVDFVENVGDITVGEKARYIARITDTELCLKVYKWVQNEYGKGAADTSVPTAAPTEKPADPTPQADPTQAPEPAADPAAGGKLVVGWYAKTGTSGLDEAIIEKVKAGILTELSAKGYKTENTELVIRAYDGKVDEVQTAVLNDSDVDVMIGMKAFALGDLQMEVQENVVMGAKSDRRIHRISDSELSHLIFDWLKTDEARSLFTAQ